MVEVLAIALGLGAGLGGLYFGGLWLTVQKLPDTPHPGRWWLASLMLRLMLLLAGFYSLLSWQSDPVMRSVMIAAALVGLLLVRTVLIQRAKG